MKKLIGTLIVLALAVAGCSSHNRVTNLKDSPNVVQITPDPIVKQSEEDKLFGAFTMLEVIRKACRKDGYFYLMHEDVMEKYYCYPARRGHVPTEG